MNPSSSTTSSSSSTSNPLQTNITPPNINGLTIPQAENVLQRILAEKADVLRKRLTISSQLLQLSTENKLIKQDNQEFINLYNEILPSFYKLHSLIYDTPEPKPLETIPPLLPLKVLHSSLDTNMPVSSNIMNPTTIVAPSLVALPPLLMMNKLESKSTLSNDNDMYDALMKRATNVIGKVSSSRRNSLETAVPLPSFSSSVNQQQHVLFTSTDQSLLSTKDPKSITNKPVSSPTTNNKSVSSSIPPQQQQQPLQDSIHSILYNIQDLESQAIIQQSRLIAGKIMVELNHQNTNNNDDNTDTTVDTNILNNNTNENNNNMLMEEDNLESNNLPLTSASSSNNTASFEQERFSYLQEHAVVNNDNDMNNKDDTVINSVSTSSIPPSSPVQVNNENTTPATILSPAAAVINTARINISKSAAENLSKAMDILESVRTLSLDTSEKLISTTALQNQIQNARDRINITYNQHHPTTANNAGIPPKIPSSILYPNKSANVVPTTYTNTKDNKMDNISAILSRVAAVTTEVVTRSRSNSIVDVPNDVTKLTEIEKTSAPQSPITTNPPAPTLESINNINVDNLLQSPTTPLGVSRSNSPILKSTIPNDNTMDIFTALLQGAAARVQAEEEIPNPTTTAFAVPISTDTNANNISLSESDMEVLTQKLKEDISNTETEAAVLGTLALMQQLNNKDTELINNKIVTSTTDNDLRQEVINVNNQLTNLLNNPVSSQTSTLDNNNNTISQDISEALAIRRKKTEELRNQRKAASNKIQAVLHPMPSSLANLQTVEEFKPENSLSQLYTHVHHSVSPSRDSNPSLSITPPGFSKKTTDSLEPTTIRSPHQRVSASSPSSGSPRPVWLPSGKFHNALDGSMTISSKPNSPSAAARQAVKTADQEIKGILQESHQLEELAKQMDTNKVHNTTNTAPNPPVVSVAKATVTALPDHDARSLVKARLLKQKAMATKDYTLLKKTAATIVPPPTIPVNNTGTTELGSEPVAAVTKAEEVKKHKMEIVQASVEAAIGVDDVQEGANKLMLAAAVSLRNRSTRANTGNDEAIDPMPDVPVPPAELIDSTYNTNTTTNNNNNKNVANKMVANALLSPHTAKRKWVQERIGKKK